MATLFVCVLGIDAVADHRFTMLPNGWELSQPAGPMVATGTMPQGAIASPDGSQFVVTESGFNAPDLAFYAARPLHLIRRVFLKGAFGRPVWTRAGILVAGANADAIFDVDSSSGSVRSFSMPPKTYPVSVAVAGDLIAVATDGDGCVRIAALDGLRAARPIAVGKHPGNLAFNENGQVLFVTVRAADFVARIDVESRSMRHIRTDLHPSDVLVKDNRLYVAQADADTLGVYDVDSGARVDDVFLGTTAKQIGSSPNAIASDANTIFVSLGAANELVLIQQNRVISRVAAGWYPTDVVPIGDRAYVIDGKGEGTKPNPGLRPHSNYDYIAAIQYGSIRELSLAHVDKLSASPQGQVGFGDAAPPDTIVRPGGPIRHVFFILKENRSYDQILGDVSDGNGDPKLTWFGDVVTPNQHVLARRFGLFDNFYASGEVSDTGHNWADAAFVNDYVERFWPSTYGGRRDMDDVLTGAGAATPQGGYIWDAAKAANVTFRDYGEMALIPSALGHPASTAPTLGDRYDPHYVSWNLDYSDRDREKEWEREFRGFLSTDTVPQLEYIWLPNDHTYGSRVGKPTPASYVATNDYAVGLMVQAISHSKIWSSSVIFVTEDDAQDGPDHVSDQRTTLYAVSPYAAGGVIRNHYSTVGVIRTIEILLGMRALSAYDARAVPLYSAFQSSPHLETFSAMRPKIDLTARNSRVAYGERQSEAADFSRPDAVPALFLIDILAHNRSAAVWRRHGPGYSLRGSI